jgi:predicted 3-demethylubiquinone-9 3-methyltransferase (glyoxalase superfamily)
MADIQKITTFLWFDDQAEEAAKLYTSLFDDSRIVHVQRHGEGGQGPVGAAFVVTFELAGIQFTALNGGPHHKFNEAISLSVDCADQEEVDRLWAALTADGGEEGPCGWLKDKYGLSWQIVPRILPELLSDPDPAVSQPALQAMMGMKKLDVAALKAAAGR